MKENDLIFIDSIFESQLSQKEYRELRKLANRIRHGEDKMGHRHVSGYMKPSVNYD